MRQPLIIFFQYLQDAPVTQRERLTFGNPCAAQLAGRLFSSYGNSLAYIEEFYRRPFRQPVFFSQFQRNNYPSKLINLSHNLPQKNKKCAHRSRRTKNANSDSRQTNQDKGKSFSIQNLMEFAFLTNSKFWIAKKSIVLPRKSYFLYLIELVWQHLLYHHFSSL